MAIFFNDTFSGSGALNLRTPDVSFGGLQWASAAGAGGLTQAAGGVKSTTSTPITSSVGSASYGVAENTYGLPASIELTFIFKTGTSVDIDGANPFNDRRGFQLYIHVGDTQFLVACDGSNSGSTMDWTFGGPEFGYSAVSLAANTTYTGTFSVSEGVQSITMFGVTRTASVAFSTPGKGLSRLDLVVGASVSVENMSVDGVVIGSATSLISCPMPVLTASGAGPGGVSFLSSPRATLKSFGGANSSLTAPSATLFATGRNSAGDNDFTYTAPVPTLSARGGANAKLTAPSPTLTTTATFTNFGRASITAPSATLSASGTVSGVGQAALTFSTPYKLVGYSGAVASITLTGKHTVQATSTAGSIGGAAITCPLFELSASGTAQNYGSASLLAPAARLGAQAQAWLKPPGFTLTAIGSATITATYEAYAVNLLHRNTDTPVNEATRYTNFPFTHVVRYKNSYYGANATGLYLLEGTTDDGVPIPWEFKTTITDFESPMAKTVVSAYFAGRMGPEATVGIHLGESGDVSYSHSTPRGPVAQNYRQVFGLGLKARYYALSVAGEGIMELDSVEFNTKTLSRRI